jgi:phosphoribosylformylglycinamidine synthase
MIRVNNLPVHCLVVQRSPRLSADPRASGLLLDAHALGLGRVTHFEIQELFFIEGDVSLADLRRLAAELLSDPVAQTSQWRNVESAGVVSFGGHIIEVALRPGVTDPVADQIVRCAKMIGIDQIERAATGQRYIVHGDLSETDCHTLARRLLANAVIQRYAIGQIDPIFPHPAEASGEVEVVPIVDLDPDGLLDLSRDRRAALDLNEMQAIQNYFRSTVRTANFGTPCGLYRTGTAGVDRSPTDVEFETIAQTWSEHCVHKTFKAKIVISDQGSVNQDFAIRNPQSAIDGLLKTYIRAATEQINAPWVRSAFVDNAGIIDFDDEYEVSFKVETHNHPSAIEPFGGANTGVGGVIRDVLGVSAKPIAATDVLCFGPQDLDPNSLPEGVLHPRRIRSGVVAGVQDYGNKIGIPTVNGAILYDESYTANPLVFCGCVGLAPKDSHPRTPLPEDRVIVLGGRTGRDGLRGATFSSMTMDAQTGEVAGASVQIGDPITEKGLIEVIIRARDARLYHAITDCGAGGLSSAVGEMASDIGADIDLKCVKLKYPGLAPWEIWLSEAQERMVLAVPPSNIGALQKICDIFDVELTDIGAFTNTQHLIVRYDQKVVLDLANEFLHDGLPRRSLIANISLQQSANSSQPSNTQYALRNTDHATRTTSQFDNNQRLLNLLSSPNISSKADVIRIYDHEVQGGTVVKPLTGVNNDGPSDACVIKPIGTQGTCGIVLSNGINPELGKIDPYAMAINVIDEAIRNAVAVGADPDRIALLDNFCWGDPLKPETLGGLVEAARGCYDAAIHYRTPFISGKDSLNNEYLGADGLRHSIPPTLLISAIGIIEDVNKAVTMDLKEEGNSIYLIENLKASSQNPEVYRALHQAITGGLIRACHDLSEGGLAVAAAEMCIGGRLGMSIAINGEEDLFSEGNGRLVLEIRSGDSAKLESHFAQLPDNLMRIGVVTHDSHLKILSREQELIALSVIDLAKAWGAEP